MKKQYSRPLLDIEIFRFDDVLTNSNLGPGEGGLDKPGLDGGSDDKDFIINPVPPM